MVDEFIYQFQSFAQYRGKLAQKSPHELELLKKCDGVWDLQGVLHYLQGLIDKSGIVRELASDGTCIPHHMQDSAEYPAGGAALFAGPH